MRNVARPVVLALTLVVLAVPCTHAHALTFEERVEAQAAIERVYASHRSGTTRSFEQAVPQSVLRKKVRTYLKQTVALEQYWNTSVTAEMLERELERMTRQTLMPERLEELFAALGNDPVLVRECLARPALVRRLTRNFFMNDERIHGRIRRDVQRIDQVTDSCSGATEQPLPLEQFPDLLAEGSTTTWDDWWKQNAGAFDEAGVQTVARNAPLPRISQASSEQNAGGCPVTDTWDNGSLAVSSVPRGLSSHTAVWTGTEMLVWGRSGCGPGYGSRYDPAIDAWTEMSKVGAPAGRYDHIAVWTGSQMLVWGGRSPEGTYPNTGAAYDPATDSWTPLATIGAPASREDTVAIWTGSRMVVWGGMDDASAVSTGGQYDPATDTWTPVSTMNAPFARTDHTAVWTGSQMLVWGGVLANGSASDTGGRYDPASDSWTSMSNLNAPPPRSDYTAVWSGSGMLIWSRNSVVGGAYSPSADAWVDIPSLNAPPSARGHSAVWTGSYMVIWGGYDGASYVDSGALYNPVNRQWAPTSQINTPEGRSGHTTVWTGSRMIVWGAYGNTGGRFNPATNSWTPTAASTYNGPPGHYDDAAVWTGNLMIVWGAGQLGEVYDPVLDVWTPTSLTNAPSNRIGHRAVWTGDEMLVWGGAYALPDDPGGRYDPVTDSWTAMSNVGAPPLALWPAAVWTGSEMIVWGGNDDFGDTNVGGRYDPATDSWSTISLVDVPVPRAQPAFVWTGSEMIVWGGFAFDIGGGGWIDTGGRYDPMTDTWQPTSLVGAPSSRVRHPAVWTGSRMIVWGGDGEGSTTLDTGGVYDPVTDSWTATSLVNAPSARELHTAVWTGRRMVVWGGFTYNSGEYVGCTGGRYDPVTDSWEPTSLVDAPSPGSGHNAVWTGTHMLLWGGPFGRYALGDAIDDDGDGFSECAGDCNDGNANVFPGAAEICDGLDNDCGGAVDNLDFDMDGHGACAADCNDADAGAFAFPPEIANLTFTDKVTLSWDSAAAAAGSATVHDIVIGLLSEGPVGSGVSETCLTTPAGANTATHLAVPDPGECYRFVIRGRNSCGAGTYGAESDGSPRSTAVCP
ncbi:MAG: MopE-related protein [Acidobacteriota bacterium]